MKTAKSTAIAEGPHDTLSQLKSPPSSDRQHLSYDVCLEIRGEIIRTVLFFIVYWSCAQS